MVEGLNEVTDQKHLIRRYLRRLKHIQTQLRHTNEETERILESTVQDSPDHLPNKYTPDTPYKKTDMV